MSVLRGDCVEVMAGLADNSIDAIVTDPPYALSFMGKSWDDLGELREFEAWTERWAREAYRILKPGGHLLAFGGSRTYHRLAAGIEDAGFEIRDQLMWVYASGFPKSLDVSKAIDKAAGAEREVVGKSTRHGGGKMTGASFQVPAAVPAITAPATDAAREWSGWGTALKPAHEPIVMARKPLVGTVAQNVQEHGTGALNIDGCRIGFASDSEIEVVKNRSGGTGGAFSGAVYGDEAPGYRVNGERFSGINPTGRWPANVILTDPVFDGGWDGVVGGGEAPSTGNGKQPTPAREGWRGDSIFGAEQQGRLYGDTGTYSRFFLVPKAPSRERTLTDGRRSPHPTQKPEALIRHLVTLVTPPGGIVLDPFLGSGTLGVACEALGVRWLGIEREDEYADWAEDRIADRKAKWEVTA